MALFKDELNKTAVAIGKNMKLLDELAPKIINSDDIYANKEIFYTIAYTCRVGILDRIEKNGYGPTYSIFIPTGLFRTKKATIANAISMTIGRLRAMSAKNPEVAQIIEDILEKDEAYYEIESIIPISIREDI